MRMLGLGLLAVVLAGAAIALSGLGADEMARKVQNFVSDPTLSFETAEPSERPAAGQGGRDAVTLRAAPRQAMILSGVPSYQGARFVLPFDARPESGVLHVDFTSQTLDTTEAALRVTIDNARRAEVLLSPGVEHRGFDIALTEAELSRGVLPVSFSLQGRGSNAPCTGPGIGAVVEIEPTSGLNLTLDGPITTPRDQAIAWGGALQAAWPEGQQAVSGAERLTLAADLIRDDYAVSFAGGAVPGAFDLDQLKAMIDPETLQPLSLRVREEDHYDFPVQMTAMAGNDGVKRFHRTTTWRSRFEAGSLPAGEVPGTLDLGLKLGPLPEGHSWTLDVTLNGALAMAESLPGTADELHRQVSLPAIADDEAATLEVTLSSDQDIEGICNEGPELLAEMLPDTRITGRDGVVQGPLADLRGDIAGAGALQVGLQDALTAPEAAGAARLIAALAPQGVALTPVAGTVDTKLPQAVVLAGGAADARTLRDDELLQWVVWSDPDSGSTRAMPLEEALADYGGVIWPVALLLDLPQRDLAAIPAGQGSLK